MTGIISSSDEALIVTIESIIKRMINSSDDNMPFDSIAINELLISLSSSVG